MTSWIRLIVVVIHALLYSCISAYPPNTVVAPYPSHPGCGRQLAIVPVSVPSGRAIHGNQPWIAAIRYGHQHQCEGVLISPDWIVSTARCLNGVPVSDITVVIGEHSQSTFEGPEQTLQAERVIIHPQYESGTARDENDIALMRLSQSVNMSNAFANTVCMPVGLSGQPDHFINNENCQHAGWNLGVSSSLLQSVVDVRVLSHQRCVDAWADQVSDNQVCVTDTDYNTGLSRCEFGKGSPVICYDSDTGRAQLVGLSSFGDLTCGRRPHVYTRVDRYLGWIHVNTGLLFTLPVRNVGST